MNGSTTVKKCFILLINESKYYLMYTSKAVHVVGVLDTGTSRVGAIDFKMGDIHAALVVLKTSNTMHV